MAKKTARRATNSQRVAKPAQARKKAAKSPKRKTAKQRAVRESPAAKQQAPAKRKAVKRPGALGRARVPGTADLDQMFRNDYEARQVFEFLRVKTVKELEEHAPDQIIADLTAPMVQTVERIRKALAVNNRFLAGDQTYAVQFVKQIR